MTLDASSEMPKSGGGEPWAAATPVGPTRRRRHQELLSSPAVCNSGIGSGLHGTTHEEEHDECWPDEQRQSPPKDEKRDGAGQEHKSGGPPEEVDLSLLLW